MTARRGRPEAVLFDLDGTLVDSALGIAAALTAVRNRHGGGAISPDGVRPWISLGAKELVRRALEDVVPACSPADLTEFRAELARTPADRACIYPGVEALLEALFEEGVAAAVVTNKPEDLSRQLLRELGLADQFAAVVGGDTTARPKPDPAPVRAALEDAAARLGVGVDELTLVTMERREWPDTGLGCPQESGFYAQVITPGYLVVVQGAGRELEYHTDEGENAVLCEER